jgi:hypothetical protein
MEQDGLRETAPLTKALCHTADTYDQIALLCEDQPRFDLEPMGDLLHDYRGLLSSFPDIITVHKVRKKSLKTNSLLTFGNNCAGCFVLGSFAETSRTGALGC